MSKLSPATGKFWSLFEESIIVQSTVTLMLVGAVVYLYCTSQEVPKELLALASLVLGYWFKSKNQFEIKQLARNFGVQSKSTKEERRA